MSVIIRERAPYLFRRFCSESTSLPLCSSAVACRPDVVITLLGSSRRLFLVTFWSAEAAWMIGSLEPLYSTHLIQRPYYLRGSLCPDPAGNRITWRPLDHRKEAPKPFCKTQWKGEEDEADRKKKWGRQHQGMDRLGVRQVPEGSGEQRKTAKTGCEVICGDPTTPNG